MSSLAPSVRQAFQTQCDKFKKRYFMYGIDDHPTVLPCKRVHKAQAKLYPVLGDLHSPSKIKWILDNDCFPPTHNKDKIKVESSHGCCPNTKRKSITIDDDQKEANPCIEPTHIHFEPHPVNMERMKCHYYIKKYIQSKQQNQYTAEKDKIPCGPFFVKDIPREIRLFGFKDENESKRNYNYNDTPRRSARLKDKVKGQNNNSIFKIKCNHNPKCFMNIGKM